MLEVIVTFFDLMLRFFVVLSFRSYDPIGVMTELNRIQLPGTKGTKMDEGLKVTKEQLFDRTSRDWVYKVRYFLDKRCRD